LLAQADTRMYRDKERRKLATRARRETDATLLPADEEVPSVERVI